MEDITLLITGAGAPGIAGTLYSLQQQTGLKLRTIGVDIDPNPVGKLLLDKVYAVSKPSEEFIAEIMEICKRENINIVLPQVTRELSWFAKNKEKFEKNGIKVMVSDADSLESVNDKYKLLELCRKKGIQCTGKYFLTKTIKELEEASKELGYPKRPFVIKLPVSNGMRGLRIIDGGLNRFESYINDKPDGTRISLTDFESILANHKMPELLAMEYYPGPEYSVDLLADKGKMIVCVPRERLKIRSGITFMSKTENNPQMIEHSKKIVEAINLDYILGFQYKLDAAGKPMILECNPRVQGTMVASTLAKTNIILGGVKQALNGSSGLRQSEVEWG